MGKKVLYVMITGDYEAGPKVDLWSEMIAPTSRILDVCEEYDAAYTIFFDVCEYFGIRHQKYDNATARQRLDAQLQEIITRGHDVQLHIHPHWAPGLGNEWTSAGWKFDLTHFRLHSLPLGSYDNPLTVRGLFRAGIDVLESIAGEINPSYRVCSFRAGGYCIQPSHDIVGVMRDVGILADSSVWYGGYRMDEVYSYDFRRAPHTHQPYYTTKDVLTPYSARGDFGVLELPIASMEIREMWRLPPKKRFTNVELCTINKKRADRFILSLRRHLKAEGREHNFLTLTSHPKALKDVGTFRYFIESTLVRLEDVASVKFLTMSEAVKLYYTLFPIDPSELSEQQNITLGGL